MVSGEKDPVVKEIVLEKPKEVKFMDNYGNSEVVVFKKDLFWMKYILFVTTFLVVSLYFRYYF